MRFRIVTGLTAIILAASASAQHPAILSFRPDGTISWTNTSVDGVAVIEELSPATSGEWAVVHSQPATALVAHARLAMTNRRAWFRVVNTNDSAASLSGMVLIPAGSSSGTNPLGLANGLPEVRDDCRYPATYSLSVESFYIDRYEVTNDEMVRVMQWALDQSPPLITASVTTVQNLEGRQRELLDLDDGACSISWDGSRFGMKAEKGSGYPCVVVTWYGAAAYCNYRSKMEGRTPCYNLSDGSCNFSADGYRLPSGEEWEYAARGGAESRRFPWGGDTISHSQANYAADNWFDYDLSSGGYHPSYDTGGFTTTSPVGSFAANAYGLHDMAGNVWEWCTDWHPCQVGSGRVIRGGGWGSPSNYCRTGVRSGFSPGHGYFLIGFRSVLPAGP